MNLIRFSFVLILALFSLAQEADGEDAAASFRTKVKPLLDAHCVDCHGPDIQKAGLRLDSLSDDLRDERVAATWVRQSDKIAAREMPPATRERPPEAEMKAATHWLRDTLHTTSLERQKKSGRVIVRRLNRTEYENTIHDLLATRTKTQGHPARRQLDRRLRQRRRRPQPLPRPT